MNGLPPRAGETTNLVSGIRDAYNHGDAEASRLLHDARAGEPHEEAHSEAGEYLKVMVFGGLDGILTSFAVVAGAAGGGLDWPVVLVLGFSNILADALSMGVGEYLSSQAHNEYVMAEKRREEWELKNHREGEIAEMVAIFTQRGMSQEDASDVVNKMAKYDDFFVNLMMSEELQLQVPESQDETIKEGFIMFLSFATFGALPLLGYTIFPMLDPDISNAILFKVACAVTGVSLFLMGAIKSKFATRSWYASGVEMVCLGGVCAAVAFEIGNLVDGLLVDP
eukprot:TRINITY_DN206_c8_g1_i1.p1 TRINITY_DN206_c8_g1~~TRINITY_DN206_c8_g1_i1.p1  ORF type:complete len:281 (-),score=66.11 TRINITY_DN206_c8_g1_i1:247-1089(-)